MTNEGYIKFDCRRDDGDPPSRTEIADLIEWRNRLHRLGLIGVYPDGVGYGNISQRRSGGGFIISGTQTGAVTELDERGFTVVEWCSLEENALRCRGPVSASSESLTHAALYAADASINAVVHIHHLPTWNVALNVLPTTDPEILYGTPAMAVELARIAQTTTIPGIAVMGGHREGLVSWGGNLVEGVGMVLASVVR